MGDPVCWLDRTCPACGRFVEEPTPRCPRCGEALDEGEDAPRNGDAHP